MGPSCTKTIKNMKIKAECVESWQLVNKHCRIWRAHNIHPFCKSYISLKGDGPQNKRVRLCQRPAFWAPTAPQHAIKRRGKKQEKGKDTQNHVRFLTTTGYLYGFWELPILPAHCFKLIFNCFLREGGIANSTLFLLFTITWQPHRAYDYVNGGTWLGGITAEECFLEYFLVGKILK